MSSRKERSYRTEFVAERSEVQIDHSYKLLTIGSCFSQSMGQTLIDFKFNVLSNPYGTVFNPISIFNLLSTSLLDENGFVEINEEFFHSDFHSDFRAKDKKTLETLILMKTNDVQESLLACDVLFITLGTSYVYEHKHTGHVVSNCHKIPQKEFAKRLLTIDEMIASFLLLHENLISVNPKMKFIFTVSPVRHVKDGLVENNLSKSLLRVFCSEMEKETNATYFPSYEIMIDDLRDYRFYKDDMLHPTRLAEDYIWEKFQQSFFTDEARKITDDWTAILSALEHRPFNVSSAKHQKFLETQLLKLDEFANYFDVESERMTFQKQLN